MSDIDNKEKTAKSADEPEESIVFTAYTGFIYLDFILSNSWILRDDAALPISTVQVIAPNSDVLLSTRYLTMSSVYAATNFLSSIVRSLSEFEDINRTKINVFQDKESLLDALRQCEKLASEAQSMLSKIEFEGN